MKHIQAARKLGVQKEGELLHVLTYHEGMLLLRSGRYESALETLQALVAAGVDDESLDLALGMGVLLMRPRMRRWKPQALAQSCCVRVAPSVIIWPRSSTRRRRATSPWCRSSRPSRTCTTRTAVSCSRPRTSIAGLPSSSKEIAQPSRPRPRPHADCRRAVPARFSRGHPVRARSGAARSREYPFGHYLLGLLYFDTGDIARAIPELEAAVRMIPAESQFQFALGNAYARAGRKEEAARARAAFVRLRKGESTSAPESDQKLRRLDLDGVIRPESPR